MQKEQPEQRPWGQNVSGGLLAEEQGGQCGWSRVSEGGEKEEVRAGRE